MASCHRSPPRRVTSVPSREFGDDDSNDTRWEEQDMPYLSRDQQRAEGGEGDEDINGRARGPRLADTRNRRRWRSRRNGNNEDDVKEGGLHPTRPPRGRW
jgi:hypothetical protein